MTIPRWCPNFMISSHGIWLLLGLSLLSLSSLSGYFYKLHALEHYPLGNV
jgi:hypothetical protein